METIRQILEFIAPKMSVRTMDIVTYSVFAGVWVVVTVLAALGIHRLAKNKGIARLWRAYVPFYNLVVLGEVVGSAPVFRKKIKNIGLVCMILQILFVLDLVFNEISFVYNDVLGFYVEKVQKVGDVEMIILAPHGVGVVYTIFSTILSLATLIFSFGLYLEVFRSYVPTAAMPICIVTIFFSPVAPVALFVIRNRKYVNFQEYLQKRMAAFYGAPQRPVQRPQDPFTEYPDAHKDPYYAPQRPARPTAPEEPFEEFSENKKDDSRDEFFN